MEKMYLVLVSFAYSLGLTDQKHVSRGTVTDEFPQDIINGLIEGFYIVEHEEGMDIDKILESADLAKADREAEMARRRLQNGAAGKKAASMAGLPSEVQAAIKEAVREVISEILPNEVANYLDNQISDAVAAALTDIDLNSIVSDDGEVAIDDPAGSAGEVDNGEGAGTVDGSDNADDDADELARLRAAYLETFREDPDGRWGVERLKQKILEGTSE